MEYTVNGLRPFTEYEVELSVANMYTRRRTYVDELFSTGRRFMTSEGGILSYMTYCMFMICIHHKYCVVPDPPFGVAFLVFGTADVQINWTLPISVESLRGHRRAFYVRLPNGELQVDTPTVLVNASVGMIPGVTQDISVSV